MSETAIVCTVLSVIVLFSIVVGVLVAQAIVGVCDYEMTKRR